MKIKDIENIKLITPEEHHKEIEELREAVNTNYEYILYLHSIFEKKVLGKKGLCSCGKKGIYCYDPYHEEINEIKIVTCLCEDCYIERNEDI